VNLEAQLGERGGLNAAGPVGLGFTRRVDNLDMIRRMARHHLVARNSLQHRVHDRPLGGRLAPSAIGFLLGKTDRLRNAEVGGDLPAHHITAAPDDPAGLADPLECPAPKAEVHGWLTFASRTPPTANKMSG